MLHSPLRFSHQLLSQILIEGDTAIDATVGNGNDTVKIAQLVGKKGKVYGFDIQSQAIEETKKKLALTGLLPQVELHQLGHEKMDEILPRDEEVGAIVFNLGYLPKADKSIITQPVTTIEAIQKGLSYLRKGGLLLVMIYYGHKGGTEEKDAVLSQLSQLPQQEYNVLRYEFINQKNSPPFLLAVEKE